jgi:hypothetical protein
MTKNKNILTEDEIFELLEYLLTPRIRDDRYRELIAKYDETISQRD